MRSTRECAEPLPTRRERARGKVHPRRVHRGLDGAAGAAHCWPAIGKPGPLRRKGDTMKPVLRLRLGLATAAVVVAVGAVLASAGTTTTVYDSFTAPYTLADYNARWSNPCGLGDMAVAPGDTRSFAGGA